MDYLIETLAELFAPFFEQLGFSPQISKLLAVLFPLIVSSASYLSWLLVKYLWNRRKNTRTAKDLAPYWEYPDIHKAREFFVPTKAQNIAPNLEEKELADSKPYVFKQKLIPFFLKTVFDDTKRSEKYHLILAGSGMGKTTFMLNLYIRYHSFFHFNKKFKMRLYPFKDSRMLEEVKAIPKKEKLNTILLLDAFDEDRHLLQLHENKDLTDKERFRKRLDEVMNAAQDFRRVIITSRTQYFPEIEDKHYELKIPRHDGGGYHKLGIFYISPFEEKEVKKYLNKKYGRFRFWKRKEKRKAQQIIKRSPNLMVRPMLLNYIDLLVKSTKDFKNTYEVYETLVEKWLDREAKRLPLAQQSQFKADLLRYSELVALEMYRRKKTSLSKEIVTMIAPKHEIQLKNYEITGKSLLTRDGGGSWKFAHKSILEYFIAKKVLQEDSFTLALKTDWSGWDMAQQFYREKAKFEMVFVKGGTFQMGSDKNGGEQPVHKVTVPDFWIGKYPVTQKQWVEIMGENPSLFKGENLPVENVSWKEVQVFIEKLNRKTGKKFRLPSEAEWEFAARGGNESKGYEYAGSNKVGEVAWYGKNSKNQTHEVGLKKANELGLYDMSGNVWEWCEDDWYGNYKDAPDDGSAWIGEPRADHRVLRGGSWRYYSEYCRVAFRYSYGPSYRSFNYGFRCAYSSEGHPLF